MGTFPDSASVVNILNQNKANVTIDLFQAWTDKPLKSIFYKYTDPDNVWSQKCYEETNVVGNSRIGDGSVTITCNRIDPIAYLEICIVDGISNGILSSEDNA